MPLQEQFASPEIFFSSFFLKNQTQTTCVKNVSNIKIYGEQTRVQNSSVFFHQDRLSI